MPRSGKARRRRTLLGVGLLGGAAALLLYLDVGPLWHRGGPEAVGPSGLLSEEPGARAEIFCYTFVRTPAEPTAALWARQAAAACDGWALYGYEANATLGVVQAYSAQQAQHGWDHRQEDQTLFGAWRLLARSGELWKYAWIVKMEPDTFIRPSALRRGLLSYNHSKPVVVSSGGGGTHIEGWFVALPAATVDMLYRISLADKTCDRRDMYVMMSGHNNEPEAESAAERGEACHSILGIGGVGEALTFEDAQGNMLSAQPEDSSTVRTVSQRCLDMPQSIFEHFASADQTGGARAAAEAVGALCGCRPGSSDAEHCISHDVAIVHPVKDVGLYSRLGALLP